MSLQMKMDSSMGPLYLVASDKGLQKIIWKEQKCAYVQKQDKHTKAYQFLLITQKQITDYLQGRRQEFSVPLDIVGTEFQKQVWNQLRKIPFGKTWSYKELATKLKKPLACRAVGTANGRNPISLIIPCHRVIASDGGLGGYAGGLSVKQKLLQLENLTER